MQENILSKLPFGTKLFAIIVAGGSGSRMKSEIPKQFLPLNGKPILIHTVEKFLQIPEIQVIVVLPKSDISYWEDISQTNELIQSKKDSISITEGGASRFQSVKNGLSTIHSEGLVAVHDGVRPLINLEIIQNSFIVAHEKGTAVTSVWVKDSVRFVNNSSDSEALDRTKLKLVQTPQTFNVSLMKKAFEVQEQSFFTDCASVLEFAGESISLIDGAYENIKITTPEDMIVAEAFLRTKS
ncbi:2-C-methyl-D-erythritol 4-phosphate cytidylyltransferase [Emticicia oligotrophica DSM 17448]|uniref:2-C-methyl-D-erythritol 4-phosphate cytidylyltransferase n=1 Tax=Emticicia oligotrophica (strain DSM 17448 / CIP 109782 / MTCC 6937 / GPTSA100-15) TaxID=929562 RepID=A0ABN4AR79_EMTOG|nr:2-C-methyl-D-erythritol 4-phosphate cytidylyltransferase [Emticicia oligotrophica]AFK05032.1 2-C-methyl-D-erythritol 4-phosphate cytidylyltransferase [Emticicia oligotrophica DSM 17448]